MRKDFLFSQEEMASLLHISPSYLSKIERGKEKGSKRVQTRINQMIYAVQQFQSDQSDLDIPENIH